MFASTLFADEADVRDFEHQVEALMRGGQADEAAIIVAAALGELARDGQSLAALCLALQLEDVALTGWDRLAERIAQLDEAGSPITAIGIDISWPGHVGLEPDAMGQLEPYLETSYYSDAAFPFSTSTRQSLLGAYSNGGPEWTGNFDDIDSTIELRGLGQVYSAVAPLVERLRGMPGDDPLEADAMRIGAVFVAVRVHQAVRRAIATQGLPRALAVIVGSNESYPFLNAPVMSSDESADFVRGIAAVDGSPSVNASETLVPMLPEEPQHPSGAALRQRFHASDPANDEAESSDSSANAPRGMLRRMLRR